jgi:hypothetical protein
MTSDPYIYQALAIRAGLLLYAKTEVKPNSARVPSLILKRAAAITGKEYRLGQYEIAAKDLLQWAEATAKAQHGEPNGVNGR